MALVLVLRLPHFDFEWVAYVVGIKFPFAKTGKIRCRHGVVHRKIQHNSGIIFCEPELTLLFVRGLMSLLFGLKRKAMQMSFIIRCNEGWGTKVKQLCKKDLEI